MRVRLKTLNLIHSFNQVNWIFLFVLLFHIHCSIFTGVMHGISISNESSDCLETEQCHSRRWCLNIQMTFCNNHACLIHLRTFCLVLYLCNFETISKLIFWVSMSSWLIVVSVSHCFHVCMCLYCLPVLLFSLEVWTSVLFPFRTTASSPLSFKQVHKEVLHPFSSFLPFFSFRAV